MLFRFRFVFLTLMAVVLLVSHCSGRDMTEPHDVLLSLDQVWGDSLTRGHLEERDVLVVLWTTWCPACVQELLHLRTEYSAYAEQVRIVAVNLTESEQNSETVVAFLEELKPPFPVLLDEAGDARTIFPSRFIPANFLVSPSGEIVRSREGAITLEVLREWMEDRAGQ